MTLERQTHRSRPVAGGGRLAEGLGSGYDACVTRDGLVGIEPATKCGLVDPGVRRR